MQLTPVCDPFPHCVLLAPTTDSSKTHTQVSCLRPAFLFFFCLLLIDFLFPFQNFRTLNPFQNFRTLNFRQTSKKPAYCFLLKAYKCTLSFREIIVCTSKQLFLLVTRKKKKVSRSHRIYPVSPVKSLIGLLRCTPDDAIQFGTVLV